tara:strand:+ start:1338 stop:1802 length:465 start_codon:yes stop_codon:yes gene_type:complete
MATIQEMLAYDTLMSGDLMRRGMAMGNIPPGKGGSPGQPYEAPKEDPANPYVPAPGKKKGNEMMMVNKSREEAAEELDEEDTAGDPSEFPRNQELMIAGGPELGGTGRKLTLGEYKKMRQTATDNFMQSDFTEKDYLDFQSVLDTGRRQMFDGV